MSSGGPHKHDTPQMRRALAELAIAGDREAFECLYSLCHSGFVRLAYRLCGHADAAHDIVQEAAITMARKIESLKDPSSFSAWAYRIIRYRVQDYFRREQRRPFIAMADEGLKSGAIPDIKAGLSLRQCLEKLSEADRQLLLLFYVDGFTGHEISEALGVPLGTIKSRLFAIRQNFKHIYDNEGDHNE